MRTIALIFVLALGLNAEPQTIDPVTECQTKTKMSENFCKAMALTSLIESLPNEVLRDSKVACNSLKEILKTYLTLTPKEITIAKQVGIYKDLSRLPSVYENTLKCARSGFYD